MNETEIKSIHEFSQISQNMQEWDKYLLLAAKLKRPKRFELFKSGIMMYLYQKMYSSEDKKQFYSVPELTRRILPITCPSTG